MKCTACTQGSLIPGYIEADLPHHQCDHCGGSFLSLYDHSRWLAVTTQESSESTDADFNESQLVIDDTRRALICPKTGTLMTKYKVSPDRDNRLDLSPSVNSVWLDNGEWELLKRDGLARQLNQIFTRHFQKELRAEEAEAEIDAVYEKRFGEHFAHIKEFKEFLVQQKNAADILAYLRVVAD